jgi:uncharacterized protein (TIGR02594 family)
MNTSWLSTIGILPKVIQQALSLLGTEEEPGAKNSVEIMDWAKTLGLEKIYTKDEIAWCGLFVAYVCHLAGKPVVNGPLWARNWANWEELAAGGAKLGDVLVFRRGSGGHVGFYIAETRDTYWVLGGNQKNKVSIEEIAKHRLITARRCKYSSVPGSVKAYVVASSGKVSSNEA